MTEPLEPPIAGLSSSTKDFLAGGVAGVAGVVAGQPLDTIRIRLQQPHASGFSGALQCWRAVVASEGFRSLFKGLSYPLTTISFQNAIVFQAYGAACRAIQSRAGGPADVGTEPLTYRQVFAAGMAAGLVQTAVITPVDLLKIRQQLQLAVPGAPAYIGPLQLMASILRREGPAGLYRGLGITLVRDVPSHGVYFMMYEGCREWLEPGSRCAGANHPLPLMVSGGMAGVLSWASVYSFDVVKSRLQAHSAAESPYTGVVDCAVRSYREEGAQVFWRGLSATLARAFLVNGVIFTTYELTMQAF